MTYRCNQLVLLGPCPHSIFFLAQDHWDEKLPRARYKATPPIDQKKKDTQHLGIMFYDKLKIHYRSYHCFSFFFHYEQLENARLLALIFCMKELTMPRCQCSV